jgi:hypothetical protein
VKTTIVNKAHSQSFLANGWKAKAQAVGNGMGPTAAANSSLLGHLKGLMVEHGGGRANDASNKRK